MNLNKELIGKNAGIVWNTLQDKKCRGKNFCLKQGYNRWI